MLLKQTLRYLPAQLTGPLAVFAAAIVWTHYLSAGDYGTLMLALGFQELVGVVTLLWWSLYTQRYLTSFGDEETRARYQRTENFVLLGAAVLQAAGMAALISTLQVAPSAGLYASAIAYAVSRSILGHYGDRARTAGAISAYTIAHTVGPLLGFALGQAFIMIWQPRAEYALWGLALAHVIAIAAVLLSLKPAAAFGRPSRDMLKDAASYGGPLLVSGGLAWASMNAIRPLVERMADAAAAGLLSVGWGLGQRLMSVAAMLVTAASFQLAVKRLENGTIADALAQLSRNGALLAALLAPATLGLIIAGEKLVPLIVAAPFVETTLAILPVAALAAAIRNLRVHFPDQVFLILRKTELTMVLNLFEAAITVSACIAGFRMHGITGAAWGCLIGSTAGTMLGFAWTTLRYNLQMPWGSFARIAVASAAMAAALKSAPWPPGAVGLGLQVAAGVFVYFAALSLLHPGEVRKLAGSFAAKPSQT